MIHGPCAWERIFAILVRVIVVMLVILHLLESVGGGLKEGGNEGVSMVRKAIGPQPLEAQMENMKCV